MVYGKRHTRLNSLGKLFQTLQRLEALSLVISESLA